MVERIVLEEGISVVIATRDRPAVLEETLHSLQAHLRPSDERIVVDSASRDPAVQRLASDAGVPCLRLEKPGVSRARNAGMAATSKPIVAFIDDECLIAPGWPERVESAFDDPRVGFVTGLVTPDRDTKLPIAIVVHPSPRTFPADGDPTRFGGGANMSFRRSAFLGVGGFDESMGPGARLLAGEDHDAFWRLLRAGWVGVYDPSIVVTHQQWRGTGRAILRHYAYGVGVAALIVKLIRVGAPIGWPMLRGRLWHDGIVAIIHNLRKGHESAAAAAAVKATGVVIGSVRAAFTPIRDDHYMR
jgi:glycosyltransferase involved in cell wall biosynthesis